jgi:hypothetical protein
MCSWASLLLVIPKRTLKFFWLFVKILKEHKIIMRWQTWWKVLWCPKNCHSTSNKFLNSWFQILDASLFDGLEVSVKHIDMHLKIYFVDFTKWLVMPYTVSPNYLMWSLKNGPTIWLRKFDDQRCLKLPDGVSKPIWFHPIWGNDVSKLIEEEEFINSGISKYLEFWKLNIIIYEVYPKAIRFYIEY